MGLLSKNLVNNWYIYTTTRNVSKLGIFYFGQLFEKNCWGKVTSKKSYKFYLGVVIGGWLVS